MIRELDGGYLLRRASPADIPAVVDLHVHAHARAHGDRDGRPATTAHMTDLLVRPHPSFNGEDMTVVEEPGSGRLVSAQHFSTHAWTYGGIPFPVGEIEHVSTHREARRRGLVRAQVEVMHGWAAERGLLATVINGIPWYYTQFGYELCLEKWWGPTIPRWLVPALPPQQEEPYRTRPATPDDLGIVAEAYEHGQREVLVGYRRDSEHWSYELERSAANPWRRELRIVEDADGEATGFVSLQPDDGGRRRWVDAYELLPGVPWALVTPSLARSLLAEGNVEEIACGWLGSRHPAVVASPSLFVDDPTTFHGAWYVRIPDVVAFLRRVTPALEARLQGSDWAGWRGQLRINLYRRVGVELGFDRGRIGVEAWRPGEMFAGDARFADQIFEQLVLGYRSLAELERSFVYRVMASNHARSLLTTLFGPRRSFVLPVY